MKSNLTWRIHKRAHTQGQGVARNASVGADQARVQVLASDSQARILCPSRPGSPWGALGAGSKDQKVAGRRMG